VAARAVDLAQHGVPLEGYPAAMIARHAAHLALDPGARRVFLDADGRPLRPPVSSSVPGDTLAMPEYAQALNTWAAHGPDLWRRGPVADALLAWMERHGGWIAEADLRDAPPPALGAAPSVAFDGFEVHGPPGTAGFPFVAQVLNMWADASDVPLGSVAYLHRLVETFRLAFADRDHHAGDPEGGGADLAPFYDAERARRLAALVRADRRLPRDVLPGGGSPTIDAGCTTHVNAVDADGMAIAGTFTLGHPFGAAVVVPDTGTLLPNVLYQFARTPGHPNEIRAGRRPVWNGCPVLVTRDGGLVAALGAPGARRIPTALVQMLLAHLRYGLAAQAAIDLPRIHAEGDLVEVDDRVPIEVVEGLRGLGHDVRRIREGPSSASFARPTCIEVLADGALACGLDAGRLATAAGTPTRNWPKHP
jgi:gamma-glutamyltranspeptidase/glutathione hydrolase